MKVLLEVHDPTVMGYLGFREQQRAELRQFRVIAGGTNNEMTIGGHGRTPFRKS
jgi:hypothetical protein